MQNYSYQPKGVCSKQINFDIEDNKLYNVKFTGGCPGNTAAIGKLLEGMDAERAVAILKGNDCAGKGTSCADQLAIAVEQALSN
ncbi:MAG: TIGR03905 family TSCPD domain-containing protein [Butyrivibrio sp.]|nr:TIGR03905 family TSCPD domain-containing protein [Butyrivibrio sp.]